MSKTKRLESIEIDNIINESKSKIINKVKIPYKKQTKKELYSQERLNLLNKLNNILGVTNTNNIIYLYDIDNFPEKQKQIDDLKYDIKKYFKCGTWSYFTKEGSRQYLSLIRCFYKEMGYDVTSSYKKFTRDDKRITGKVYIIHKSVALNFD